jgi:hypothetical protein
MGYSISNGHGESMDMPSVRQMREFLFAVDASDEEHGAAWLSTDSDHSLEWNGDGRLVFTAERHAQKPSVHHLLHVSRDRALELWCALADGNVAIVEREKWQPGNGFVDTPERRARIEADQLADDRAFYDLLGEERAGVPCKRESCSRGAIFSSVLCRVHHFESIRGRPSPFED